MAADDRLRDEMRNFVAKAYCLPRGLLPLVKRYVDRMTAENVDSCLTLGAATLSLENLTRDFNDSFDYLLSLYAKASSFGINAQPRFSAVAAMSSSLKGSRIHPYSMRELLEGFDRSHQFQVDGLRKLEAWRHRGGVA